MSRLRRFRERLVLGPIVRYLDGDEQILAWAHASVPGLRSPGVLVVTNHYCRLHVASTTVADLSTPLAELSGFTLDRQRPEVVRVRVSGEVHEVAVELSLTSRARSRSVGRVLSALAQQRVDPPGSFDPALTSPLPPMTRGVRHHARRVWVTVLGVLVLLLSALFASPFVPGPGALTAVAGVAILAREYEWARDLHVWSVRQAERFIAWLRDLRARRRRSGGEVIEVAPQDEPPVVDAGDAGPAGDTVGEPAPGDEQPAPERRAG